MKHVVIKAGLAAAFLVIALQWLIVIGFIAHSYTWWLKVHDPMVTAGVIGTVLFSAGSAVAVLFTLWAHGRLHDQRSRFSYLAQLLGLAGLSGLLIFFGMASLGYVEFVQR